MKKHRCPAYLVVVAMDEQTARWAEEPNPYFQLNSPFLPLVVGPGQVPTMTSAEEVRRDSMEGLLSLSMHAGGPRGEEVAAAVLKVAPELEAAYKVLCVALLMQLMSDADRKKLEEKLGMDLQGWLKNNDSELIRNMWSVVAASHEERGEARGEAKSILKILRLRGLAVTAAQEEQVLKCQDPAVLDRWMKRVLSVTSVAELLG